DRHCARPGGATAARAAPDRLARGARADARLLRDGGHQRAREVDHLRRALASHGGLQLLDHRRLPPEPGERHPGAAAAGAAARARRLSLPVARSGGVVEGGRVRRRLPRLLRPGARRRRHAALVLLGIRLASGRPMTVTVGGRREVRSRPAQLLVLLAAAAVQAGVVVLVTWGFYRFRYAAIRIPSPEADPLDWPGVLGAAGAIGPAIAFARDHRFLPEAFLYGFARFLRLSLNRPAFLNGELSWV